MTDSDDIKEELVSYYSHYGIQTTEKNWKRTSKKKVKGKYRDFESRTFENKADSISAYVISDDGDH